MLAIVDDLHEGDADAVTVVAELGRACEALPVLVVAAARVGSGPSPAPLNRLDPTGATAKCKDGTYSKSAHRSGTCSSHGGVAEWLTAAP